MIALNYAERLIWGRRIPFFLVLLGRHSWTLAAGLGQGAGYSSRANSWAREAIQRMEE